MSEKLLSVIVITKNEAQNIQECLKSVEFADEIIVFDSGSSDETVAMCYEFTDKVYVTLDWPGDGPQKNRALAKASGRYVLCLDADERVSSELKVEIQKAVQEERFNGYQIPFSSTYLGKAIRFGDWRKEQHLRLFRRGYGQFSENIVHTEVKINGDVGQLNNVIVHHPFVSLDKMLNKLNDYSTGVAKSKFEQGKKASIGTAIGHGLWTFFRGYFIRLGFLDGKEGFLLAISNAEGTYYRYLKLMYMGKSHEQA